VSKDADGADVDVDESHGSRTVGARRKHISTSHRRTARAIVALGTSLWFVTFNGTPPFASLGDGHTDATRRAMTTVDPRECRESLRGTCETSCPEAERARRVERDDIDPLERGPNGRVIRRYARNLTASSTTGEKEGDESSGVRTLEACEDTCAWLLARFGCDEWNAKASTQHQAEFLWDRLRGVRQDLSVQNCFVEDAQSALRVVALLERMVTHTLETTFALRRLETQTFNEALHTEQLGKTFGMLLRLYADLGDAVNLGRMAEFFSLWLCLRIDATREISVELRKFNHRDVISSPQVRFAIKCHRAYASGNGIGFFRLIESSECSHLHEICLEKYFTNVRLETLRAMNIANNSTTMTFDELARILRLEEAEHAKQMVQSCNLRYDDVGVAFRLAPFRYPDARERKAASSLRWSAAILANALARVSLS
jgi:hypothetical protein